MFLRKKITRLSPDKQFFYVDLRPRVDFCLKYTSFNNRLHIFRRYGNRWKSEHQDPGIRLLMPAHDNYPDLPISEFIRQILAGLRREVARFDYLQVKVLQICAQSPEGRELFLDSPVFVWLISDYLHKNKLSCDHGNFLVRQKRRDVLKMILGKGSKSDIRMLKKIHIHDQILNKKSMASLQYALENDDSRVFRHFPEIPLQLLMIYQHAPHLIKSGLGQGLAEQQYSRIEDMFKEIDHVLRIWGDVIGLGEMLQMDPVKALEKCDSLQSLKRLHDEWTGILNRKARSVNDEKIVFPKAPVKGNDMIIPIMNLADLREEGAFMHHCVGSYARRLLMGDSYIFKVLQPERSI